MIGFLPICPISAKSASPPVIARNTPPRTAKPPHPLCTRKAMACRGSTAASTCGLCSMPAIPSTAIAPNHSSISGPNTLPMRAVPRPLYGKQADQDGNCHRHDVGLEDLSCYVDALERAQDRDCRCDDAVTINQGGSEQAHHDERAAAVERGRAGERHQRQDPALAMVVSAHHEEAVLDGDRDDERPQDQREDADSGLRGKPSTDGLGDRLQGVEWARPEVAIDDAERGECCRGRRSPSDGGRHGPLLTAGGDRHLIPAPSATSADAGYRPIGGAQPLPDARPGSSTPSRRCSC